MGVKYTKEDLQNAVSSSQSLSEVIRKLGIRGRSGSLWSHFRTRIDKLGIDTSHFVKGNVGPNHKGGPKKKTPKQILRVFKNVPPGGKQVRRAMLEIGIEYKCSICGIPPAWNGKSLTLQIDHINGNRLDNRPENLRFVCPNCHSQTSTWGHNNIIREDVKPKYKDVKCSQCGKSVKVNKKTRAKNHFCCNDCKSKFTEINDWPPPDEFTKIGLADVYGQISQKIKRNRHNR